jgi:hypothetical protein
MTTPQENQVQATPEAQPTNKELNFRALEAKMQQERNGRLEAEKRALEAERMAQEAMARRNQQDDSAEDDEPYIDKRKLAQHFSSFERKMDEKIDKRAEEKARAMVEKERKDSWLRNNPDFYDILQYADKFAERDPELAETILQMPEGFERQKLVYKNIKALGIHKPSEVKSTIQEKVDANRRSPYYQPTGVGTAPYAGIGDFSAAGQKNAYQKMQDLKNKLRI